MLRKNNNDVAFDNKLKILLNENTHSLSSLANQAMVLIRLGASPNILNSDGNTLLHILVGQNDTCNALIEKLVKEYQMNIDIRNKKGKTPLQTLLDKQNQLYPSNLIKYALPLIKLKANTNILNERGNSLLHILVGQNDECNRLIEKLVGEYQMDIDILNDKGKTPLQILMDKENNYYASTFAKHTMLLVKLESNLHVTNGQGKTLLDLYLAKSIAAEEIEQLISIMSKRAALVPSSSHKKISNVLSLLPSAPPLAEIKEEPKKTIPDKKNSDNLNNHLNYSASMVRYLESFDRKESFSTTLAGLKLSKDEESQLEEFRDPITEVYMNIPVFLNGNCYDLDTIKTLKIDPLTQDEFKTSDIQPGRLITNKFLEMIKKIEQNRVSAEKAKEKPSIELNIVKFGLLSNSKMKKDKLKTDCLDSSISRKNHLKNSKG